MMALTAYSMRCVLFLVAVISSVSASLEGATTPIECLYLKGHLILDDDRPDVIHHRCSLENNMVYNIPDEVLERLDLDSLKSGETRLSIGGVEIQGDEMVVLSPGGESDSIAQSSVLTAKQRNDNIMSRSSSAYTRGTVGVRTIMVVRVQSLDNLDVSLSTSDLEFRIFDQGATTVTNQYRQCSNGELTFLPASLPNAPNGVGDVSVNLNLADSLMSNGIENALTAAFMGAYGSPTQFDHVMFCMPKGMGKGWKGYTYGRTWQSYYEDPWCGYYSLPVHEIGHNLGLQHSTEDGEEYGDRSCLMGVSYSSNGTPNMCFNAAKMWAMGWYQNYRAIVNPARDGPWRGNVVGFVDVSTVPENDPNNSVLLINVGDLYLLHNRLKNFNAQSIGHGNRVTVARAVTLEDKSDLVAGLSPYLMSVTVDVPLDGVVQRVVIEICERILGDILSYDLSIRLAEQASACGTTPTSVSTPPPSPNPTLPPVLPPSLIPTTSPPTPNPTTLPPTLPPTPIPTTSPPTPDPTTLAPTLSPTPIPTTAPATPKPTIPPSPGPTPPPTVPPTLDSTSLPTTKEPTPAPTTRSVGTLPFQTAMPTTPLPTEMPLPPTVMPTPSSGANTPLSCFSDRMTVELEDGSVIAMRDLKVGTMVKVDIDETYSRVYAFGHWNENMLSTYLALKLKGHRSLLELSPDHMLFTKEGRVIPASMVHAGDEVLLDRSAMNGDKVTEVLSIKQITRRGAYAPFTGTGTIMVNGIKASTYVSLQNNAANLMLFDGSIEMPLSHQWMAHTFAAPFRWIDSDTFVTAWIPSLKSAATWFLNQRHAAIQCTLLPFLIGSLLFISMVDNFGLAGVTLSVILIASPACCFMLKIMSQWRRRAQKAVSR